MDDDEDDDDDSEEPLHKFTGCHKLIMFCSPVFIGGTHIVFMTLNHQANNTQDDVVQRSTIVKLLIVEQFASFFSMLFALLADSYSARYNVMKFAVLFTSIPIVLMFLSDISFGNIYPYSIRKTLFLSGVATLSVYYSLMPVEKAFVSELIPPYSPFLRKYCFIIHFMSYVWQALFGILISLPNYFPSTNDQEAVIISSYALQSAMWFSMIVGYCVALFMRRGEPRNVNFGIGIKSTICLGSVLWVNVLNLVRWFRDRNSEIKDGYVVCSETFTLEVVNSAKKIFKLFIINFCLMFFHGLELILRTVWYQQDSALYRETMFYGFPLDVILLLTIVISLPVVEFLILPFFKKYTRIHCSDLKLVGISNVLLGFAYVLTMMISMKTREETRDNPGPDKITVRIYNIELYPIEWMIKSNSTSYALIHLPHMKSKSYVNNIEGDFTFTFTSSYDVQEKRLHLKTGDVFNFLTSHKGLASMESLDRELKNAPLIGKPDSHIFVFAEISNFSPVNPDSVKMEFSGPDYSRSFGHFKNGKITHVVLYRGRYQLAVSSNINTLRRTIVLHDFSLYTILIYTCIDGKMNLRLERLRSGSSLSRFWAFPQVVLTGLAIAVGVVSVHIFTYQHAPSSMLGTAFSFHRFAFACSIITFNLITSQRSLTTLGLIGVLIFIFILTFYFVTLHSDLNFEEEDARRKKKMAQKDAAAAVARTVVE